MKKSPTCDESLSIAEASARSGLSPDTLRYYDKLGILPNLRRNGGRRSFSEQDMAALSLISCLRDTGDGEIHALVALARRNLCVSPRPTLGDQQP